MDIRDKIRLLIRVAQKCPEESNALLAWANELLDDGPRHGALPTRPQDVSEAPRPALPFAIFRVYKGRKYDALLLDGWRVEFNGKVYSSPSAAAIGVSGHNENGWITWRYVDAPSGRVLPIDTLRHT